MTSKSSQQSNETEWLLWKTCPDKQAFIATYMERKNITSFEAAVYDYLTTTIASHEKTILYARQYDPVLDIVKKALSDTKAALSNLGF
jgi:hypothetical protein